MLGRAWRTPVAELTCADARTGRVAWHALGPGTLGLHRDVDGMVNRSHDRATGRLQWARAVLAPVRYVSEAPTVPANNSWAHLVSA